MKSLWLTLLFSSQALALTLNVADRGNLTTNQIHKLEQAITITNQVINSAEFRDRVLGFQYAGKTQFAQTDGLSNEQVYDILMSGAEYLPKKSEADGVADMMVTIYYPPWYKRFTSAVAFTSPSDPFLHIYSRYFASSSIPDLSATLMHEWTHKLGFDHDFNSTARRPYTVPYGVGSIVSGLVAAALRH